MPVLAAQEPAAGQPLPPLRDYVHKSYLKLFKISPSLHFTQDEFNALRDQLDKGRKICVNRFKDRASNYDSRIQATQQELKKQTTTLSDERRHDLHCKIQNLRAVKSQAEVFADHAIPVAYENEEAKLDLIEHWPQDVAKIKQEIADGSYKNRRWGDVKDIGYRTIAAGQKDDIKTGKKAVKQMKDSGLLPPALKDAAVVHYVDRVAHRVAAHSDLEVPLHVTVLDTKEINAFALPGGFLFVDRGLLDAVDDESELAGVLGHEMGHVVARHGHKLSERGTVAGILFQAAEVAGMVLTGGAIGIGTYYALEYGYQGLSLLLNLSLLGVSREYELQADQLGIQYAWASGYDPSGFIRFFDKMATQEGYVNGISWFYDHPPFYQRMLDAEREIMFLPHKSDLLVQTPQFREMKKELAKWEARKKEKAAGEGNLKPQFIVHEHGCSAPNAIKFKPGEHIETLCSSAAAQE